jgi:hypothetical protein
VSVTATHPGATVPGGLEIASSRTLPDGGLIEFEQAPVGWLKRDGEPRRAPWRAYFYTPPGGRRRRLPSVTTILDALLPKPGLPRWAEGHGIVGAIRAVEQGLITFDRDPVFEAEVGAVLAQHTDDDLIAAVRRAQLGADAAKDHAADRGTDVHLPIQEYMETGRAPSLRDHRPELHGYLTAFTRWLLDFDPEPVAAEQLVCNPRGGYAGRLDLRARLPRACAGLATIDFKTQADAKVYEGAHIQVNMYEQGAVACGAEEADQLFVVALAADGTYRMMPVDKDADLVTAALIWRRKITPIKSACATANQRELDARRAVIA